MAEPPASPPPPPAEDLDSLQEDLQPVEVDLTCDECGGALTWDPAQDALSCEHCGTTRAVERRDERIVERPLSVAADVARGLGVETRVVLCSTCGARVNFGTHETATSCPFCGGAQMLDQEVNRNAIRPESLIPLDVGEKKVKAKFDKWIQGLWFRPNALKKVKDFAAIGIYVPAWTFDADVYSDWSADSGTYYYVTESYTVQVNGKTEHRTRQVRKIRWRPAWGNRTDHYDDLEILASKGIDRKLGQELGDFDTTELVPYRPEYLAGWRAEEYQIDLEAAYHLAQGEIISTQRARCAGDVPGDTHRNLRVDNDIENVRWKHVLLPMWSLTYQFGGKPYPVLVHGQSGRIVGKAPLSWVKILLAILVVLAIGGVVLVLSGI